MLLCNILWPRFKDSWPGIDVAVPVQAEKCSAIVRFSFHLPLLALAVVAVRAGMSVDGKTRRFGDSVFPGCSAAS